MTITDDYMKQQIAKTKEFCLVILNAGPKIGTAGVEKIIWEHGRRNFSLRRQGLLSIVCPINDGSGIAGVGIFDAGIDEVREIMDEDPAVKAGIFGYEIHPTRSFLGDCLPK